MSDDWQNMKTAPKDKIIRLLHRPPVNAPDRTPVECDGLWAEVAWRCVSSERPSVPGGMVAEAIGWKPLA
jgi:hypothetical protein